MRSDEEDALRNLDLDIELLAEAMSRGDDDPFEHHLDIETGELVEIPRESSDLNLDEDELGTCTTEAAAGSIAVISDRCGADACAEECAPAGEQGVVLVAE